MKNFINLSLAIVFFVSCKTSEETAKINHPTQAVETTGIAVTSDSLLVYLERTACYGQCPMYKFSIYNSGYAVYEGKRFVEKTGRYDGRIAKTILDELKNKAIAINYFGFKNEYPKTASDFPSVKTALVLNGKRKDIMDGSNAPSALKEFEKYLDSIKDSVEWRQVH